MNPLNLRIVIDKNVYENGFKVTYKGDAGIDCRACIDTPIIIRPNETILIPLGIYSSFSHNYVAMLYGRSGLAYKNSISLANCAGVIDSVYRDEWKAMIKNSGTEDFVIEPKARICQVVFTHIFYDENNSFVELDNVEDLIDSDRGTKGFGSSGTN